MNSINLSPNNSMTSNFILDKIFPQTYYQANQNKNYYDYSVVFFFNNDSDDLTTKNIYYGFGYVFYALNEQVNSFFFIPKVYCFISKYPFLLHYHQLS